MKTHQVTLPNWLYELLRGIYHNWAIFVVAILSGIVVGFIAEFVKHRYTLAEGKKIALSKLHVLLGFLAAALTGIQYYIPILQTHLRSLETLPYIGSYVVSIYAAAVFIYSIKGKAWYKAVFKTVKKIDPTTPVVLQPTPTVPALPETESNFETV